MIRSSVVLPQPDGPTIAPTFPSSSVNATSRNASRFHAVSAEIRLRLHDDFKPRETANGRHYVQGPHHESLDRQHDDDEGKRISEQQSHIEKLERDVDLEADPIGAAQQLDDQHYFPDQR